METPVYVIVDGHAVYRSEAVQEFVESPKGIRVFFLRRNAPEANPIEQAWNHVKSHHLGPQSINDE